MSLHGFASVFNSDCKVQGHWGGVPKALLMLYIENGWRTRDVLDAKVWGPSKKIIYCLSFQIDFQIHENDFCPFFLIILFLFLASSNVLPEILQQAPVGILTQAQCVAQAVGASIWGGHICIKDPANNAGACNVCIQISRIFFHK